MIFELLCVSLVTITNCIPFFSGKRAKLIFILNIYNKVVKASYSITTAFNVGLNISIVWPPKVLDKVSGFTVDGGTQSNH